MLKHHHLSPVRGQATREYLFHHHQSPRTPDPQRRKNSWCFETAVPVLVTISPGKTRSARWMPSGQPCSIPKTMCCSTFDNLNTELDLRHPPRLYQTCVERMLCCSRTPTPSKQASSAVVPKQTVISKRPTSSFAHSLVSIPSPKNCAVSVGYFKLSSPPH